MFFCRDGDYRERTIDASSLAGSCYAREAKSSRYRVSANRLSIRARVNRFYRSVSAVNKQRNCRAFSRKRAAQGATTLLRDDTGEYGGQVS